jgi:transcriptional regulator with XRE-family HTH domain
MKKLKETRKKLGLTQDDIAKLLGVSQAYISRIESGQRQPSAALQKLITFLPELINESRKKMGKSRRVALGA